MGIVFAIYILWVGADHPGGKFQSATILAAMWMLVLMAGLADAPPIGRRGLRFGIVVGPGWCSSPSACSALFVPVRCSPIRRAGAKPMIVIVEVALMPTLPLVLGLLLAGAPQTAGAAMTRRRRCSGWAPPRWWASACTG